MPSLTTPTMDDRSPHRPTPMKRHSSTSSHNSHTTPRSPHADHPLRAAHMPGKRHARVVLPRNHSSGRNLQKLGRAQAQLPEEDGRKHQRVRSGETEIRLPGSLGREEEDSAVPGGALRRNMTEARLPRNSSHTKLRKNHSHGALTRLGSTQLKGSRLNDRTPPPSPGLKGKNKRPKSADLTPQEQDQANAEALKPPAPLARKVGFAVGSATDNDEEDVPHMEGSGLEEGEWTEASNSASPYSTRNNTAQNSRSNSVLLEKPPDTQSHADIYTPRNEDVEEESPQSSLEDVSQPKEQDMLNQQEPAVEQSKPAVEAPTKEASEEPSTDDSRSTLETPAEHRPSDVTSEDTQSNHSQSTLGKQRTPESISRRLLSRSSNGAPPMVSSVSALDTNHSTDASPTRWSRPIPQGHFNGDGAAEVDEQLEETEIISKFINESKPTGSYDSGSQTQSGSITNTPQTSFQQPAEDEVEDADRGIYGNISKSQPNLAHVGPTSPGSTLSGHSSGAVTPAMRPSRTEMKLMLERGKSHLEAMAEQQPIIPAHVYDRRNVSLKSYFTQTQTGLSHGGGAIDRSLFTGRFKAVEREYQVARKFRNPLQESYARLEKMKGSRLHNDKVATKTAMRATKSAVQLPSSANKLSSQKIPRHHAPAPVAVGKSSLATSVSPPKIASLSPPKAAPSSKPKPTKRVVSFAGAAPEVREFETQARSAPGAMEDAEEIARGMWEGSEEFVPLVHGR